MESKRTILLVASISVIVFVGILFVIFNHSQNPRELSRGSNDGYDSDYSSDYKNATYLIDGRQIHLVNGSAETEAATGSAAKVVTRFFGNELRADLNNDGREDVVFLLTQNSGGSGTFFYVVAALNTEQGYRGSDGYVLGDRIAPQTTEYSRNPQQKNVIVVNYADRAAGEPMTVRPSVGKSVYLKLDSDTLRWGVVLSPEEQKSL